jgi:hypothetical protein
LKVLERCLEGDEHREESGSETGRGDGDLAGSTRRL